MGSREGQLRLRRGVVVLDWVTCVGRVDVEDIPTILTWNWEVRFSLIVGRLEKWNWGPSPLKVGGFGDIQCGSPESAGVLLVSMKIPTKGGPLF